MVVLVPVLESGRGNHSIALYRHLQMASYQYSMLMKLTGKTVISAMPRIRPLVGLVLDGDSDHHISDQHILYLEDTYSNSYVLLRNSFSRKETKETMGEGY